MIPQYIPPPQQPVPAEIRTINADKQRLESPEQSFEQNFIDDYNQKHYDDGLTLSIGQPKQAQPDKEQQMQDLNNSVEGIADGVAEFERAKEKREENENLINAAKGPGYADHPPDVPSPEKDVAAAKKTMPEQQSSPSESTGQSADSGQNNDRGYDYYNGIM